MKKILRSWGTSGNLGVEAGPVVQIMLVSFGLWVGWWGGVLNTLSKAMDSGRHLFWSWGTHDQTFPGFEFEHKAALGPK